MWEPDSEVRFARQRQQSIKFVCKAFPVAPGTLLDPNPEIWLERNIRVKAKRAGFGDRET